MGLSFLKTGKQFVLLALAAAMVASLSACSESTPAMAKGGGAAGTKKSSAISVQITYPETETLERKTEFAGRLEAAQSVKVYPEVSGTVTKTYFSAGDAVKKGDLLFELDDTNAQIALKKAELAYQKTLADIASQESGSANALTELDYQTKITSAQNTYEKARATLELELDDPDFSMSDFKKARKKYKAAQDAYDANPTDETYTALVAAEQEYENELDQYGNRTTYDSYYTAFETAYDNYEAALKAYDIYKSMTSGEDTATRDITRSQAELDYQDAQKDVEDCKVYAPVSGVIAAKNISDYNVVSTQTSSYVISQEGLPTVSFNLSEDGALAMTLGAPVVITYNGKEYNAEVIELSPEADSSTGLYAAKAQFTDDIGATRSGAVVKVMAITDQEKDAITVSIDNVYYEGNQPYVYIYDSGTAKRVDITIGMATSEKVSVTAGLAAEDAIITTWHPSLKDGAKVTNTQLDGGNNASSSEPAAQESSAQPEQAPAKKEG